MGRIKTTPIKRVTHQLMKLHANEFSEDFDKNKEVVNKLILTPSRKLRNNVAGYVTRLVKKSKEPKDSISTGTRDEEYSGAL